MKSMRQLRSSLCMLAASLAACAYHGGDSDGYRDLGLHLTKGRSQLAVVDTTREAALPGDDIALNLLLLVPLWPFVTIVHERDQRTHYPVGYLADQIVKVDLAGAAAAVPADAPKAAGRRLEVSIEESALSESRTTYGLSVAGAFLQSFLALPQGRRRASLRLRVVLRDESGHEVFARTYDRQRSKLIGTFMPLWLFGPQWTYGQHDNPMARIGEDLTREILLDLERTAPPAP
jgi:hypothetical protein